MNKNTTTIDFVKSNMEETIEMRRKKLTLQKFIDHLKKNSTRMEYMPTDLPNNKFLVLQLFEYMGQYFIVYEIFSFTGEDSFELRYYDEEQFQTHKEAMIEYISLLLSLQNTNEA